MSMAELRPMITQAAEVWDPRMKAAEKVKKLFGEMTEKNVAVVMEIIQTIRRSEEADQSGETGRKYGAPSKPYEPLK